MSTTPYSAALRADILMEQVLVRRAGQTILDVSELAVSPHTFLGIVGPNGAGKTTLLKVISGLLLADAGSVTVLGTALEQVGSLGRTRLRRRIGYVPQRADYNPDLPLTVHEVVELGRVGPRGLLGSLFARSDELVEHWLEKLGLAHLATRTFRSLSGGEQQKVLIARAMVQQPKILLLDEPAANLDLDWKERLVSLLERLFGDHSITVIMVSHETGLLPECTTAVALMHAGKVFTMGTPAETLTEPLLARAYGVSVSVHRVRGRYHVITNRTGEKGQGGGDADA